VYYFAESEKKYEGEFYENQFEGKGVLSFKNGQKYDGEFKNGKKEGHGTMQFQNGNKYIGSWKEDQQNGMGVYFDAKSSTKRQGEWKKGKRVAWLGQPSKRI